MAQNREDVPADPLRELLEVGIGLAILGLRQVNITRQSLVSDLPQAEPIIDVAIDAIEGAAAPVSQALGAAVSIASGLLPEPYSSRLSEAAPLISRSGPELLRLSGLTARK